MKKRERETKFDDAGKKSLEDEEEEASGGKNLGIGHGRGGWIEVEREREGHFDAGAVSHFKGSPVDPLRILRGSTHPGTRGILRGS